MFGVAMCSEREDKSQRQILEYFYSSVGEGAMMCPNKSRDSDDHVETGPSIEGVEMLVLLLSSTRRGVD